MDYRKSRIRCIPGSVTPIRSRRAQSTLRPLRFSVAVFGVKPDLRNKQVGSPASEDLGRGYFKDGSEPPKSPGQFGLGPNRRLSAWRWRMRLRRGG